MPKSRATFTISSLLALTLLAALALFLFLPEPDPVQLMLNQCRGKSVSAMQEMPPGYLRSFCVREVHPGILNSGFCEGFQHPYGYDYLIPCVEFYERIGCSRMADIFRSVIIAIRTQFGAKVLDGYIPNDYPSGFTAVSTDLTELDSLYYKEMKNLPKSPEGEADIAWAAIGYYLERFPEDFQ